MTQRHDERYKRAVARITEARRQRVIQRAAEELGLQESVTDSYNRGRLERLVNHKLGIRQAA